MHLRYRHCVGKPAIKPKLSEMRDCVSAAIVAMAIGAIAGGEMILSRVDVPTSPASAAPAQGLTSATAAQPHPQPIVDAMDSGARDRLGAVVHGSSINPKIVEPAAIAPSTEVGPNDASVKVATPAPVVAAPATKIRRVARHVASTGGYGAWGWGGSRSY
jgi:hypothetical protein